MKLMEVLKNIRPSSLFKASLKKNEWTMTRDLHRFPDIPLSNLLFISSPLKDGAYIIWKLRLLSCIASLWRNFTWNNVKGSKYNIKGKMYAGSRNPFMG